MLDHSLQQYRQVLADTTVYELKLDKAQTVLNEQTGTTVTGVSSRQQAVRKAVQQMNRAGLSGFRDAGGHLWSAEAYVNMDIRTTAHNVATQAVFTRNEQYGNSLVAVSAHSGARELCYPYQGKVYSTDGSEGYVEDLHGRELYYEPLENTSYGLPAGLLGINCGHFISPFIPGLSVIRDVPQEREANDKQYALSQQQRKLERDVRYAKREAAMMDAMGDKEGFEKAAAKVQKKQQNLDRFISSTGRTKRVDRTQTYGYNKSVAGKVSAANQQADKKLTPLERIKKHGIDEGGKYKILPYSKYYKDGKKRPYDPGVEEYKRYILPEFWSQNLSKEDNAQLWAKRGGYIQNGPGYKAINNYLRGFAELPNDSLKAEYEKTIDVMRRTTSDNSLQSSYIGFRKVAPEYLQIVMGIKTDDKIINPGQNAYFNSAKSANQIAKEINALVGTDKAKVSDKTVTSVSLCENINYFTSRSVKFVIQMPQGTKGLITNNWPESEFMAQMNTSLEIIGAEANKYIDQNVKKDGVIIYARMVQD